MDHQLNWMSCRRCNGHLFEEDKGTGIDGTGRTIAAGRVGSSGGLRG